ncbi:MAG: HU family DNA-binding protein [Rikenellaceae bacterium]
MNKTQLIEQIAQDAGITKVDASRALSSFIKLTSQSLKNGEKVVIPGFGTFHCVNKQGRVGRNPRTGEQITIEPRRVAKFKPGTELNNLID